MSDADLPKCVVFGRGGHARMVIEALRLSGEVDVVAILDAESAHWGSQCVGIDVIGGDGELEGLVHRNVGCFVVGVGSIGNTRPRERLFELAMGCGLRPQTVRHPSSIISQDAVLARGCQIFPGAIINSAASIGSNAIINTGAIVEHDCQIAEHAHVAPRAVLGGNVVVGSGAHIGIGAVVREGIRIGNRAMIAAGAVVVADVAADTLVRGVPAQ